MKTHFLALGSSLIRIYCVCEQKMCNQKVLLANQIVFLCQKVFFKAMYECDKFQNSSRHPVDQVGCR